MVSQPVLSSIRTLTAFLTALVLLGHPQGVQAGCGCDKPPPAPAAVIPTAAFAGMPVTLFHDSLLAGQLWNVTFQSGATSVTTQAVVVLKRALTDPTGLTYKPQLVVAVPRGLPMGPTRIVASTKTASFTVTEDFFTVIGQPVGVMEQAGAYTVKNYTTGVSADGTLYISVGGLHNVCQPIEFQVLMTNYPLRFGNGEVAILNHQGFFIDALGAQSADHFAIRPSSGATSNLLDYFRHTFTAYCLRHLPGGIKAVDPLDQNWHLDGTAHTEYSTLIFAIAGHFDNGAVPRAGSASFTLKVVASLGDNNETWAQEREEESIRK
jgi:hypothetical protein